MASASVTRQHYRVWQFFFSNEAWVQMDRFCKFAKLQDVVHRKSAWIPRSRVTSPQSGRVVCHKSAADCWPNLFCDDNYERRVCRHTHSIYCVTRRGRKELHIPTRWRVAAHIEGVDDNAAQLLRWQACFHRSLAPSHHSPDSSPLDYFLWGYLKDKIFETAVPNEDVLRQRITEEIQRIPPHTLRMVFQNLRRRDSCAKMFWEPSSNTFCKIKSFSFLPLFVGWEF